MLITNEYTYKTNRQNIIDGWSRNQFLLSKFIDVLLITLMMSLLYFIIAIVIGIIASKQPITNMWGQVRYVWLFALQTFSQLSIAFLIGFLVRKSFIALSIFVFYYIIVENMVVNIAKVKANDIGRFMPLEISDRLIPVPAFLGRLDEKAYQASLDQINTQIFYTFLVIAAVWGACYYFNKKRDL
jgi:ABC-2 type transport system permease protein